MVFVEAYCAATPSSSVPTVPRTLLATLRWAQDELAGQWYERFDVVGTHPPVCSAANEKSNRSGRPPSRAPNVCLICFANSAAFLHFTSSGAFAETFCRINSCAASDDPWGNNSLMSKRVLPICEAGAGVGDPKIMK